MLTIVTYHYVRDVERSPYPGIKAISTKQFDEQLAHIGRRYVVVSLDQVTSARLGHTELPRNSCLLTFDDGLIDHFVTVFPRLAARGWSGAFFPVAAAHRGTGVLDVHKIQLILAVESDVSRLVRRLRQAIAEARREIALPSDDALWTAWATPSRFDDPERRFVKNALQHGLPQPIRSRIVNDLFADAVGDDETLVARELYMDLPQMQLMMRSGMAFGGHGSHNWLGRSTLEDQREDFRKSLALLEEIGGRHVHHWTMCYPHGSYNAQTFEVAMESGCCMGLTVRPGVVCDFSTPLELPRVDATDIPSRIDVGSPDPTRFISASFS